MFDHVKFGVSDCAASKAFFKALDSGGQTQVTTVQRRVVVMPVDPMPKSDTEMPRG
jgi:hypothetical protein